MISVRTEKEKDFCVVEQKYILVGKNPHLVVNIARKKSWLVSLWYQLTVKQLRQ